MVSPLATALISRFFSFFPLTMVPLAEPMSISLTRSPSSSTKVACALEIIWARMITSLLVARPTVILEENTLRLVLTRGMAFIPERRPPRGMYSERLAFLVRCSSSASSGGTNTTTRNGWG